MAKLTPYIVDVLLVILFALLPGIRGYENWAWHKYMLVAFILAYILYLRHKPRQKKD